MPGILNLTRISPQIIQHAQLPLRGAADSIEGPPRGEHRRPTFYSRPSRRWCEGERRPFLAFAVGEVFLSSVRTAGSWLVLGGSRLILFGSRPILGWFLARSRPKRQPEWPQDGERGGQMGQEASKINEKGDLGEPKWLPEASQNIKKATVCLQSVLESKKMVTGISDLVYFGSI